MKIAISTLVTPIQKIGIGNYVINLLIGLQKIDHLNDYYIFTGPDTRFLFEINAQNFHVITLPFKHDPRWLMRPAYLLWQNSLILTYLKHYHINVLHIPNLVPLLIRYIPTVVTIPDLAEYHAIRYSVLRQSYRKALPHVIAHNASRIITISESAKKDITSITGINPDRVDVTYLASVITEPVLARTDLTQQYHQLGEPYILYVGNTLPHKNIKRLIEAYALLVQHHAIPHRLILVGSQNETSSQLQEWIKELSVEGRVIPIGYVPDRDLPSIYQRASLFAYPSLYEGFGLPVLEAMSCGTPVITSNISSLPEVAGNAAILVDPYNVEEIATSILRVLQDNQLCHELSSKGKEQASKFTWEECAQQTLNTYIKASQPSSLPFNSH
jgi:glycosyltransferase involved in cell wall biosynthesis